MADQLDSIGIFNLLKNYIQTFPLLLQSSFDSSVGRAEDCSADEVILRSLVRIRLEGEFFSFRMVILHLIPLLFHSEIDEVQSL